MKAVRRVHEEACNHSDRDSNLPCVSLLAWSSSNFKCGSCSSSDACKSASLLFSGDCTAFHEAISDLACANSLPFLDKRNILRTRFTSSAASASLRPFADRLMYARKSSESESESDSNMASMKWDGGVMSGDAKRQRGTRGIGCNGMSAYVREEG